MPETYPCDADRRTALLIWVVKSGPAHIRQLLKTRIKLLYQALLPLVWERFRHLPASAFGPLWQAARRSAARFFHSRLVQYCYQTVATWLGKHRLVVKPADRPHRRSYCKDHNSNKHVYQADKGKSAQQEQHTVELSFHNQAGPQISARSGQIAEPKQDAANKSSVDAPDGLKPGSGADPVSRDTPPQLLASPKDHNPHSCSGLRDHSLSVSASLRGVGGLEGISRQQLQTLPRRQRMPGDWSTGAAWLQSQATSAAAAAAAALSPSDSPSNDSAAYPSAAGPSPHPLPASNPKARLASKHRRHTSTTSFSAPDQAVPSSPRANALPTQGHPAAVLSNPRANALSSPGHSAAVADTSHTQTSESEAAGVAGASSSDASSKLGTASSSTVAPLTGQESLERATAGLQALQQKYAPASSASGTEGQLSSPAATKTALQSTRSTFDFRSAVSGLPTGASLASVPQTDDSGTQPQQAQAATSAGLESELIHDATKKSLTASLSQDSIRTSSLRVAPQAAAPAAAPASAAMDTEYEAQSTVGGGQAPASVQSASGQSLQAGSSQSQADSTYSDAMSQQPGTSVGEPGGGTSQLPLEDESDALSQQPHGSGSQSGSIRSLQGEQAGSDRVTKSRVGRLRINEDGFPMADIYNLQSPGPILLENALSNDESLARNDSYLLALTQPGVTLKARIPSTLEAQGTGPSAGHFQAAPDMQEQESGMFMADGQVLEGQGRGQFLGPPAQRWAAASAQKDSINRLPSGSEELENMSDNQESLALAACEVQQAATGDLHAGSVPLSHRLLCDNLAVRPKRRVRFDLTDGSESQHDQENLASR